MDDPLVVCYLVLQWMQTEIFRKNCFINSQGPWPWSVCGSVCLSPWKTAALALFLFLWLSVCLVLSAVSDQEWY